MLMVGRSGILRGILQQHWVALHGLLGGLQQYYASKIPGRKALGARFLNLRKFWVRDSYFCPLRGMLGVLLLGQFWGAWVPGFLNLGNLLGQESKNPESCSRSFAVRAALACMHVMFHLK